MAKVKKSGGASVVDGSGAVVRRYEAECSETMTPAECAESYCGKLGGKDKGFKVVVDKGADAPPAGADAPADAGSDVPPAGKKPAGRGGKAAAAKDGE